MSFYAIHSQHRETVCGRDNGRYYLFIIDTRENRYIFNSNGIPDMSVDTILDIFAQYNIPVPRNFRSQLVSDEILRHSPHVHYYFGDSGEEIGRGFSKEN